jgi:hypothetical protein
MEFGFYHGDISSYHSGLFVWVVLTFLVIRISVPPSWIRKVGFRSYNSSHTYSFLGYFF